MRRRLLYTARPFGDVNVTPLIDVVMCMIIFFLIVGKMAADQRAQLRLPETSTGSSRPAQDVLVVNILADTDRGARVIVDNEQIGAEQLGLLVRARLAEKPATVVQVRASRELAYGAVRPVLEACRAAGVPSLRLAAEHAP
ncbi:MAG: ExbD/TolR family protein [Phycisphaerales bacterium]